MPSVLIKKSKIVDQFYIVGGRIPAKHGDH